MGYYRQEFPTATVTPKFHMLEEHTVRWLNKYKVGFGLLDEQGAKSIHAHLKWHPWQTEEPEADHGGTSPTHSSWQSSSQTYNKETHCCRRLVMQLFRLMCRGPTYNTYKICTHLSAKKRGGHILMVVECTLTIQLHFLKCWRAEKL